MTPRGRQFSEPMGITSVFEEMLLRGRQQNRQFSNGIQLFGT